MTTEKFISEKIYDGFSTVFRQWRAEGTHCKFMHGYGVSFKVTFEGELDHRNWVFDFGGMKRAKNTIDGMPAKKWIDWLLDHTVIAAQDDPALETFKQLEKQGVLNLRVIPDVGAEKFAEFLYHKLNDFVNKETEGRVKIVKIKFMEHGKNSATYIGNQL